MITTTIFFEREVFVSGARAVSRPRCIRPFRRGGLGRGGLWIARLWLKNDRVKAEDLPIVARIIRYVFEKRHIRASEILPRNKDIVIAKAQQYKHVLNKYGVKIVEKQGGVSFEVFRDTLDHFFNT